MPATMADIHRILESPDWSRSEKWIVRWQFKLLGDFETALSQAISRADENNLARLELGFPEQVEGYANWAYGTLGERLRAAGLNV